MVCGLVAAIVIAHGSVLKAIVMTAAGLLLGAVGTDVATGQARFTMGIPELFDGIGFMPVAIGMFGLAEVIGDARLARRPAPIAGPHRPSWPEPGETRRAAASTLRGTRSDRCSASCRAEVR